MIYTVDNDNEKIIHRYLEVFTSNFLIKNKYSEMIEVILVFKSSNNLVLI